MADRRETPRITVCIPHWQVQGLMSLCLRSIRKHSAKYSLEVLVIDNGSRDGSLDYLRSLNWIRLIERPEETPENWPHNVFTAWDLGARVCQSEYFVTMHSDVLVKRDNWLDPLLRELKPGGTLAASGAWKLNLEHPFYTWQKRVVGNTVSSLKGLLGRATRSSWKEGHYPRDYCAMYRRDILIRHDLSFVQGDETITGGYPIAKRLHELGYTFGMLPIHEMAANVVHVTHGTAGFVADKPLHHSAAQSKAERRVQRLFAEPWISELQRDQRLDAA